VSGGRPRKPAPVIAFDVIERTFTLSALTLGDCYSPPVFVDGDRYVIRVLRHTVVNARSATVGYDYFEADRDGVIIAAPHGYARDFKGARLTGLDAAVAFHARTAGTR
jgi:hypothetical protein